MSGRAATLVKATPALTPPGPATPAPAATTTSPRRTWKREKHDPICTIRGCGGEHCAKGYCKHHYNLWHDAGYPADGPPAQRPARKVCARDGCKATAKEGDWCPPCTTRWERAGRPAGGPPPPRQHRPVPQTCTREGCGRPGHSRAWCTSCYSEWWNAGKPAEGLPPLQAPRPPTVQERREEYAFLRDQGEDPDVAAARLGLRHPKTAADYEDAYQDARRQAGRAA